MAAMAHVILLSPRPPTARIIVGHGGLSVLCANLLNIEYIDVAELTVSTIELISEVDGLEISCNSFTKIT